MFKEVWDEIKVNTPITLQPKLERHSRSLEQYIPENLFDVKAIAAKTNPKIISERDKFKIKIKL